VAIQGSAVIEFTKAELDALHSLLFDTCLYTTSKVITYGSRISATNKVFKAKEHLDGLHTAKESRKRNPNTRR